MHVHLVADTNLFFECKSLEQLPWEALGYDEITVLLTPPVLGEIDKHKKASGRTRERALEIFARVREMLQTNVSEVVIREETPRVVLKRAAHIKPDPQHADDLDYDKPDERLIGITSTFHQTAQGYEVLLFTDDTGPASIADSLGIPFRMIDPSWRRPAAVSTEARRVRELEQDLNTYRAQEPKIVIKTLAPATTDSKVILTSRIAVPLTQTEIGSLMEVLQGRHPMRTEFVPPAPTSRRVGLVKIHRTVFAAPSDEAIKTYQEEAYPRWLDRCRSILSGLHVGRDQIVDDVTLNWALANKGSRPASQVRVEFEARGRGLSLQRLPGTDASVDLEATTAPAEHERQVSALPVPPQPPSFLEEVTVEDAPLSGPVKGGNMSALQATNLMQRQLGLGRNYGLGLEKLTAMSDTVARLNTISPLFRETAWSALNAPLARGAPMATGYPMLRRPLLPKPADPEKFYYDDWPRDDFVSKGALTCTLWRHRRESETFEFKVVFTEAGPANGVIECVVHAENLTVPVKRMALISRVEEPKPIFELASAMVEACR